MKKILCKLFFATMLLVIASCNSSSTDEAGEADSSTIFVADGTNTGSMKITIVDDTISVGETTGFLVRVTDVNGNGVPGIFVACDTEGDLALIEPSSGSFLTNSSGDASGVLGCEDRGSFMMACRVAVGGATREFKRVRCEGTRPIGFEGFPDAGGGGLGNGVADVDDGSVDDLALRLISVSFSESGEDNTTSLDTDFISDCDPEAAGDQPEPFSDTIVKFKILNTTNQIARVVSYSYVVLNFESGTNFPSGTINTIGEALGAGKEGEFEALFADVSEGGRRYFGMSSNLDIDNHGFKNIEFTINGIFSNGTSFQRSVRQSISVDAVDRCG